MRRGRLIAVLVVAVLVSMPAYAYANMMIPMMAVYLPPAWLALVPVILIETAVGVRREKVATGRALHAQAVANCVSTLIGVPITFALLALVGQAVFSNPLKIDYTPREIPFAVTWLSPAQAMLAWSVLSAAGVLTIPFYVMSVAVEYAVTRRYFPELPRKNTFKWVVIGNGLSYAFLLAVMGSVVWLPDAYVSLYWETASVAAAVTPMAYVVLAYMTFWLVMDAFESRSRPR